MLTDAALILARIRLVALTGEDFEAFVAAEAEMTEQSRRLAVLAPQQLSAEDRAALNELLSLELASSALLTSMTSDSSQRLAKLAAKRRTNEAYLRSERSSVNPL